MTSEAERVGDAGDGMMDQEAKAEGVMPPGGAYEASSASADRLLGALFYMAERWPGALHRMVPGLGRVVWSSAAGVRGNVLANLDRLLPSETSPAERARIGRAVVENFIRFLADLGQAQSLSAEDLAGKATTVEGQAHYAAARAMGRGAIIATAHLGSFEVGLAVTAEREDAVHVVFATDPFPRFDRMRSALRHKLGVREARIEAGWEMWAQLRDALGRDEVVVMQADRVMPGQKGEVVSVAGGQMELPTGPVRLAQLSGAPILPIFAVREPGGAGIRIVIEEPIVLATASDPKSAQREALAALGSALGRQIARYPEQWLMLHRVWVGDKP